MRKKMTLSALLLTTALLCGCMVQPGPSETSEAQSSSSDDFSALGIPPHTGFDGFYTLQMRQKMREYDFSYQDVEALLDAGYTPAEMFAMTPEERDVYAVCGRLSPYDGDLFSLTEQLYSYIEGLDDYFGKYPDTSVIVPELVRYGESVQGRPLYYLRLKQPDTAPSQKVMLTFAIHGWEGETACDGAYLVEQACQTAFFYCLKPEYLADTELIIVPMVNPDGVMNRNGNHYFGRGQSQGIDMNRDFRKDAFRAQETVALAEVIQSLKPDALIDFHGWFDESYGDAELGKVFARNLGLVHVSEDYGTRQGYLYGYAKSLGIRSLLVEHSGLSELNTKALILSLNTLLKALTD